MNDKGLGDLCSSVPTGGLVGGSRGTPERWEVSLLPGGREEKSGLRQHYGGSLEGPVGTEALEADLGIVS